MTPIGVQIGAVVSTMREEEDGAPYYMYGHRAELAARLDAYDKNVEKRDAKYPLILLILDIPEPRTDDVVNYRLNIAIVTYKKGEKNAEKRITETIEPVLYEIYENFLGAIVNSGLFMWPGDPTRPPHVKYDRPDWGVPGEERNYGQFLSDKVDAVEIVNLELNQPECYEIELPVVAMELPEGTVVDRGTWNPQENADQLPTESNIKAGYEWHIELTDDTTPAVFGEVELWMGMKIRAKIDNPGQDITNYWYENN